MRDVGEGFSLEGVVVVGMVVMVVMVVVVAAVPAVGLAVGIVPLLCTM